MLVALEYWLPTYINRLWLIYLPNFGCSAQMLVALNIGNVGNTEKLEIVVANLYKQIVVDIYKDFLL